MKNSAILARIGYFGQEVYGLEIPWEGMVGVSDVEVQDGKNHVPVSCVENCDGFVKILLEPFPISHSFCVKIAQNKYDDSSFSEIRTQWADAFLSAEKNGIRYRLYSPKANQPRPLVLFLHGSGETGEDNRKQVFHCFGAAKLAQDYPDCYILAPQANGIILSDHQLVRFKKMTFHTSHLGPATGWTREYLAGICDIIREMIADGRVNPSRVYVTGMSMGGGGTLLAMSVGADLFAAAVPICPTMTPETYRILCGLEHSKLWITCSYLDHTIYRHKYIVDGILTLRDAGNRDAKLTMFAPEELEAYGISTEESLSLDEKASQNHLCWIPTYCNEHGVISWMMEQKKELSTCTKTKA